MKLKFFLSTILLTLLLIFDVSGQQVDRPQKLFVKHGLQYHTWGHTAGHGWPGTGTTSFITPGPPSASNGISARYIRIQLPNSVNGRLSLAEVQVFSTSGTNVALNKTTSQSSTASGAVSSRAVDGNTNGDFFSGSVTHTAASNQPWWEVDLGAVYSLESVKVFNRTDCCQARLRGYSILASLNPFTHDSLSDAFAEPGVIGMGEHYRIGTEYTDLPLTPDYYQYPQFNNNFYAKHPNAKWGIEKAPSGGTVSSAPSSNQVTNGFLTPDQLSNLSNLTVIGFGDEEVLQDNLHLIPFFKQWFDLCKNHYPNVLLHNNQFQERDDDDSVMRQYIQTAKPDFIAFDHYLFSEGETGFTGGSLSTMYDLLGRYRRLALEGTDGNGANPIEFGQYTIGFRQGGHQATERGRYYTSESQIYGQIFGSLTMGTKWLSAWRYVDDIADGHKDRQYWIDEIGNPLAGYWWYAKALKEYNNLSPHLSRLHTTDVRVIAGLHNNNGNTVTNEVTTELKPWESSIDPYLTNISATNLVSGTNSGLRGDVLVGYFEPVKNLSTDTELTMAPIHNQNAKYFMLMNGLTKANGCCHDIGESQFATDTIAGLASKARQKITLSLDFGINPVDQLKRVSRSTGNVEDVSLTLVSGTKYTVDIELDGGKADLFYWQNAHKLSPLTNLALNKFAKQSSTHSGAWPTLAVDGNTDGDYNNNSVSHTAGGENQPWWEVRLDAVSNIKDIKIYNRTDCCSDRVNNYHVFVSSLPFDSNTISGIQGQSSVSDFHQTVQAGRPTYIHVNRSGRYIRVQLEGSTALNLAEVEVIGSNIVVENLALNKSTSQSSTFQAATSSKAVDGNTNGSYSNGSVSHTAGSGESQPWLDVDLGQVANIDEINVWNRTDCCSDRVNNYHLFVSDSPFTGTTVSASQSQSGVTDYHQTVEAEHPTRVSMNSGQTGRYVRLQLESTSPINLAELEVMGNFVANRTANLVKEELTADLIKELVIYPNPVEQGHTLKIDFNNELAIDNFKLVLINISGQEVLSKKINLVKGMNKLELNTKGLTQGIYILKLSSNELNTTRKIIIDE